MGVLLILMGVGLERYTFTKGPVLSRKSIGKIFEHTCTRMTLLSHIYR